LEITLEHVTKTYGKTKAMDDVSFKLQEGHSIGLVGESGCGKSTTASVIAGLVRPNAGQCMFGGKEISHLKGQDFLDYRRNVQMVFQDPSSALNPCLTARQCVAEPIRNFLQLSKIEENERMNMLLEQVGLTPDDADKYPRAFSGGQQQRICIARAIALNPHFLLLDEVTSSLDVSVQAQIINLLSDLRKIHNMGILMISHDIGVVRYVCDKVLVMYRGNIVEELDSEKFSEAQHPYSKKLLASVPAIFSAP